VITSQQLLVQTLTSRDAFLSAMTDPRTKAQLLAEILELEQQLGEWQRASFEENEKKHDALKELKKVQQELADLKKRDRSPREAIEEQKQTILKLRAEIEELRSDKARLILARASE
jgi:uncharacterized coiled-coil DUF342 family protein